VRTPSGCFEGLAGFDYELKSVEIDGLRQGYVDDGPADADPVLLLHGQPSWAYLYRKIIPTLVDAGHRVIAMDHVGLGSSDKPSTSSTTATLDMPIGSRSSSMRSGFGTSQCSLRTGEA
jgi:haloalkane dehalogenase